MKKTACHLLIFACLLSVSCKTLRPEKGRVADDHKIQLTYLLINDVYEIAPLEGGKSGGLARVATLKKESLKENPDSYLVIAGDFLSPSVYNSLQYEGKRIRGRQMVEAMNAAGMDVATFGNHEFDISEAELQERINESAFQWVSSNTFHKTGTRISPFVKTTSSGSVPVPLTYIQTVRDADGTTAKIGFIGITLPFNKAAYVSYTDPLSTAEKYYNQIADSCDAVIALTHQSVEDDSLLAVRLPHLAVILGGHEHDMRFRKVGNVYIVKAHANAKSAYLVNLQVDKKNHTVQVNPRLKMLDQTVPLDSATNAVVQKWVDIGNQNYASLGFSPQEVLIAKGEALDGREAIIRAQPTNLGALVVAAMKEAAPEAEVAILNAGSIRVDDILHPPVSQYDIIRSLPFGGPLVEVSMKGSLLKQVLEAGQKNKGTGGYLHVSPAISRDSASGIWKIKGVPVADQQPYRVVMPGFLMTGGEANMNFLTPDNPDVVKVFPAANTPSDPRSDIRLAIVRYLQKQK